MKSLKEIMQSDIFSHWSNINYLPRWGVLLIDILIALVAFVISYAIGSNLLTYNLSVILPIWLQAGIVVIIQTFFYWVFHTYSGILRYSTFVDTIKTALSAGATGTILIVFNIIISSVTYNEHHPFLVTVLLIYVFVATTLLFSWRVIIKTVFEYIKRTKSPYLRCTICWTIYSKNVTSKYGESIPSRWIHCRYQRVYTTQSIRIARVST